MAVSGHVIILTSHTLMSPTNKPHNFVFSSPGFAGGLPTRRFSKNLCFLYLVLLLSSCAISEDTTYLTPIPQNTLDAYLNRPPADEKLQVVVAARLFLGTTRIVFTEPPDVLSIESISLEEARQRVDQPETTLYEDRPGNTTTWLVIFEGDYQIIPPAPENTLPPEPAHHGCAYVIVDPFTMEGDEGGTFGCP